MNNNNAKILFLDLETMAGEGYFWNPKWETNIIEIIEYMNIISFSAKWLDGKHITKGLPDYKGYKANSRDDKKLVQELWKLMDEADIIVAQNGKKYDFKVANVRFLYHGLTPPSPYRVVDPKVEAKKYLYLPSYSLNDICDYFGIGHKVEHEGWKLWKKCYAADKKAWARMLKYNRFDVILMHELYLKLLPFMTSHPSLGMFTDKLVCPKCGSDRIQSRGTIKLITTEYRRVYCTNCGGWSKTGTNVRDNKPLVSI